MAKVGERGGRCVLVYIEAESAHAACLGPGCHILTEPKILKRRYLRIANNTNDKFKTDLAG